MALREIKSRGPRALGRPRVRAELITARLLTDLPRE